MSRSYFRKSIVARVDRAITDNSSKDSDREILKEFCSTVNYSLAEYKYVKEKISLKYGFKFKDYHQRLDALKQWDKEMDDSSSTKKKLTQKKPAKVENYWTKSYKEDLSPAEILERFNKLKAEEKRQRLLEEVRNVDLFCNEVV